MPKVYIIVLNYQSYEDTINYVKLLQSQKNINLNILVVDNDSPNDSYQYLKDKLKEIKNVEVVKSKKNGGYAYGNNFGLRYIQNKDFDFVIISNNDILIDNEYLIYKLTQVYNKLKSVAFISPLMKVNNKISSSIAWDIPTISDDILSSLRIFKFLKRKKDKYNFKTDEKFERVECLPGSFFMSKKQVFYDIELFDENTFLYGEERILAVKIKERGLHNYLIKNLEYEHLVSKTISRNLNLNKMQMYLINSRVYFHENYTSSSRISIKLLKLLFEIWKIETYFYLKIRSFLDK
jgi:GT2 family glycosyltransferase